MNLVAFDYFVSMVVVLYDVTQDWDRVGCVRSVIVQSSPRVGVAYLVRFLNHVYAFDLIHDLELCPHSRASDVFDPFVLVHDVGS